MGHRFQTGSSLKTHAVVKGREQVGKHCAESADLQEDSSNVTEHSCLHQTSCHIIGHIYAIEWLYRTHRGVVAGWVWGLGGVNGCIRVVWRLLVIDNGAVPC